MKNVLEVSCNDEGNYCVTIAEGSSVAEVAFAIAVVLKVLERDGVIDKSEMQTLIGKYLEDPQYEELKS